jgi:hypothetical protein
MLAIIQDIYYSTKNVGPIMIVVLITMNNSIVLAFNAISPAVQSNSA